MAAQRCPPRQWLQVIEAIAEIADGQHAGADVDLTDHLLGDLATEVVLLDAAITPEQQVLVEREVIVGCGQRRIRRAERAQFGIPRGVDHRGGGWIEQREHLADPPIAIGVVLQVVHVIAGAGSAVAARMHLRLRTIDPLPDDLGGGRVEVRVRAVRIARAGTAIPVEVGLVGFGNEAVPAAEVHVVAHRFAGMCPLPVPVLDEGPYPSFRRRGDGGRRRCGCGRLAGQQVEQFLHHVMLAEISSVS